MKRILELLVVVCSVISCGQGDNNIGIVKKEFKNYVQKTFDDPKSMKEIVEIIPKDTLSFDSVKNLCLMTLDLMDSSFKLYSIKDSLATNQLENAYNDMRKTYRGGYYEAIQGQRMITELVSLVSKQIEAKTKARYEQSRMKAIYDSLSYYPALYVYEIKYRKQSDDGLKLESAYAYVDSLAGFKNIMSDQKDNEMMCEEYKDAVDESRKCTSRLKDIEALYDENDEKWEEFRKFIILNSR